jgi:hypothetical protein
MASGLDSRSYSEALRRRLMCTTVIHFKTSKHSIRMARQRTITSSSDHTAESLLTSSTTRWRSGSRVLRWQRTAKMSLVSLFLNELFKCRVFLLKRTLNNKEIS